MQKYNWNKYLDGNEHTITPQIKYKVIADSFIKAARRAATKRGLSVTVYQKVTNEGIVEVVLRAKLKE